MAEASMITIVVQLFNDWEIHLLMLLSFALQAFLFFFGRLRRRNNSRLLSILLWLAYLSADYVAVYALGYLSRHMPATTYNDKPSQAISRQTQQLMLLWATFLLIHLGGQDTVTAFSVQDNELWLRHFLNLAVQVCLVMTVLWKSVAHYQSVVLPAVFLLVAGMIKYGERIWALKCGSQKALWKSTTSEAMEQLPTLDDQDGGNYRLTYVTYQTIVKYALHTEQGLRHVFTGRKLDQMGTRTWNRFFYYCFADQGEEAAQLAFQSVDIELSMMYDQLFTKVRVVQTTLGAILRCVSLVSTTAALVLFVVMSAKQGYIHTRSDAAVTYVLFIGAFCLEACAVFVVMISPRGWALLEARGGGGSRMLARVAWSIFVRIHPETRPWWSNSMGQYNLVSSCIADKKSSMLSTVIARMMGLVGASETWNNMRHTKNAQVSTEIKKLINQTIDWDMLMRPQPRFEKGRLFEQVLQLRFDEALLRLHVYTDLMLYKGAKAQVGMISEEVRRLMDTCKGISDYMVYLLVVHPDMLPVSREGQSLLAGASENIRGPSGSSKEDFLQGLDRVYPGLENLFFEEAGSVLEEQGFHAVLQILNQVWARLLCYAAGKSRPEEHARRLSMGGELLTFVWLLMAHQKLGDLGKEVHLMPIGSDVDKVCLFSFN